MINLSAPDLTQHPPRSPRVQLGGFVHLPRLLDKARATLAGKAGEYHYNCPLDQHFFAFTGITAEGVLAELKNGRSDTEMLAWVRANSQAPSLGGGRLVPVDADARPGRRAAATSGSGRSIKAAGPERDDIFGFFDLLDLDDYVSFGGKP